MFRNVNIPILGMVQNMSHYICSNCGHEAHIFGHDGVRACAEEMDMAFLGQQPASHSRGNWGREREKSGFASGLTSGCVGVGCGR